MARASGPTHAALGLAAATSLVMASCAPSVVPEDAGGLVADAGPRLDAPGSDGASDGALDAARFDGHVGDAFLATDSASGFEDAVIDGGVDDGGSTDGGADAWAPADCAGAEVHLCDVAASRHGDSTVGSCGGVGTCEYTCRDGALVAVRNSCDVPTASFGVTGAIETWTVPATGTYVITANGGAGGNGGNSIGTGMGAPGGGAAAAEGTFELVRGQVLRVAVGEDGRRGLIWTPGTGGGGSFVVLDGAGAGTPLVVAGGGGGGGLGDDGIPGVQASLASNGTFANCGGGPGASGGLDAHGGGEVPGSSGAGGGFLSAGAACGGGQAFVDGAAGGWCSGLSGGFGGGGTGPTGGGGGGGYSGGGGGHQTPQSCGGGGGGSFVAPSATEASIRPADASSGVTIRMLRPDRIELSPTGAITSWVVPESGVYVLRARGAGAAFDPARAAIASGAVALSAGDTLEILVGERAIRGDAAGGTFVVLRASEPIPLVVAGGVGGESGCRPGESDASLTTSGNPGERSGGAGGSDGMGGTGTGDGAGGGGFLTNGTGAGGGRSFLSGGGAGIGFGGGGRAYGIDLGAGGGGGYSGGGGGDTCGGGGGSYVSSSAAGAEITHAEPNELGRVTILLP